jgi:hypothetical protein
MKKVKKHQNSFDFTFKIPFPVGHEMDPYLDYATIDSTMV